MARSRAGEVEWQEQDLTDIRRKNWPFKQDISLANLLNSPDAILASCSENSNGSSDARLANGSAG
jgi:hypothetical protein